MPPEEKFSREAIARAALEVVREEGMKSLTARRVAQKLKASTAPVYNHFGSIRELKLEVLRRAEALLLESTRRPYTDVRFLNMGTGYVIFAREEKELFRALFLGAEVFKVVIEDLEASLHQDMSHDPRFNGMAEADRRELLSKMRTYAHGLASLIWAGVIEENSDEHIISSLREVGRAVIAAMVENRRE